MSVTKLETLPTRANTRFMDWWRLLNVEMDKLLPGQQVGYGDARGCYDMGESPGTAAQQLLVIWTT